MESVQQPGQRALRPQRPGAPAWQQALEQLAAPATSARSGHAHGLLKAWRYDKVGELRASRHSLQGDKGHSYDATGRILQTQHGALGSIRSPLPQAANETFGYDPAGNIQETVPPSKQCKAAQPCLNAATCAITWCGCLKTSGTSTTATGG